MEENYKLCYVDEIPATYCDYDEESKKLMDTDEYKEYTEKRREYLDGLLKKQGYLSSGDYVTYDLINDKEYKFRTNFKDYPNPDYELGYTHYLYFTNDIDKQWGDDWDDVPYEHNAEIPYDFDTDIYISPITIPKLDNVQVRFPNTGFVNSPYSVDMINAKAVPWIWIGVMNERKIQKSIAIMGGDTYKEVKEKLNEIKHLTDIKKQ